VNFFSGLTRVKEGKTCISYPAFREQIRLADQLGIVVREVADREMRILTPLEARSAL
jgi:hypothetical protein